MLAVLSNVNCEPIIRFVKKQADCLDSVGYGNVLADLMNKQSAIYQKSPETILIIIDLNDLIQLKDDYHAIIENFFAGLEAAIKQECRYFISDGIYYEATECDYSGNNICRQSVFFWNQKLYELCEKYSNIFIFPYAKLIEKIGSTKFYSNKTWYMGSVRYSLAGVKAISEEVLRLLSVAVGNTKKVLALDLDNTLWGGIAGEDGIKGIKLAESGIGRAYKEFQQIVHCLKNSGVILAIVSKNNEEDALNIINDHPDMVLKCDDFAAKYIDWNLKSENIINLAAELNVGLDSIVFVDDNPIERKEVKDRLPEVEVPEFPQTPEKMVEFGNSLAGRFFKRTVVTAEDRIKTEQYTAKRKIEEVRKTATSYEEFLESLEICISRKSPVENIERLAQIVQKTNQFNTTVIRYTMTELQKMISDPQWQLYFYEVSDKFANHGLCAFAAVHMEDTPIIKEFLMSCRVMGRNIEYGVLDDIEADLTLLGKKQVKAEYRKGKKNAPVELLYDKAEYELVADCGEEKLYCRDLGIVRTQNVFVGKIIGGI